MSIQIFRWWMKWNGPVNATAEYLANTRSNKKIERKLHYVKKTVSCRVTILPNVAKTPLSSSYGTRKRQLIFLEHYEYYIKQRQNIFFLLKYIKNFMQLKLNKIIYFWKQNTEIKDHQCRLKNCVSTID